MADGGTPSYTYTLDTKRKLLAGIAIVIGISISWVGATQFAQSTYTNYFNAPFFTMWFSTSWMSLVYLPVVFWSSLNRDTSIKKIYRESECIFGKEGLCPTNIFKIVAPFCFLWSITNYCYLRGLGKIIATDVTALFSSCNAFVYIFSLIILQEPFLFIRVFSVILSMTGIILMAYANGFKGPTVEGVVLSIASAIGAALYKVMFKKIVGDAEIKQVALFLSCLGILSALTLWPIFEALYYTNVEVIIWTQIPWKYLLGSAVLGLIFNFLINFGIAITFPLFISLGTLLGIPINALVDLIFRGKKLSGLKIGAAFLIILGFLLMLLPKDLISRLKKQKRAYENLESKADQSINP